MVGIVEISILHWKNIKEEKPSLVAIYFTIIFIVLIYFKNNLKKKITFSPPVISVSFSVSIVSDQTLLDHICFLQHLCLNPSQFPALGFQS